jgi:opacity protein-like surface antigen
MQRICVTVGIALLLAVLGGAFSAPARAQGMSGGALPPSPVYGRLGIGYSMSTGTDLKDNDPNAGAICGDAACSTPGKLKDVGGGFALQAGIGSQYRENLRGDLTFEYRRYVNDKTDAAVPATTFKLDVGALTFLANGYYDFSVGGVKPYVGAGIGFSRNRMGSTSFDDGAGFSGSLPGGSTTEFAWALMFGVGVPVSGWVLDIGYRYVDLGKLKIPADSGTGYGGANGKLMAHELMLAMRF